MFKKKNHPMRSGFEKSILKAQGFFSVNAQKAVAPPFHWRDEQIYYDISVLKCQAKMIKTQIKKNSARVESP